MTDYIGAGAVISSDGLYRYSLWREWRGSHEPKHWQWFDACDGSGALLGQPDSVLFIMLNPSTADGEKDDATIRKCVSFCKRWNYERLEVVNLFAWRASDPKSLLALREPIDPVGWENQRHVEARVSDAGMVICAWGAHGRHLGQDDTMLGWLDGLCTPMALGFTKDGCPRHPLYLPLSSEPKPFWPGRRTIHG